MNNNLCFAGEDYKNHYKDLQHLSIEHLKTHYDTYGKYESRIMLPLSLSYDHRIIDGVEGAKPVAVGKAAKAITEGKATPPSDHIKTRFEDEVLTLDEGNQTLLWDESMKQIQSYLPESYVE